MCFWHRNHFPKFCSGHEKTRKELWAVSGDINAIFCSSDGWKNKNVMRITYSLVNVFIALSFQNMPNNLGEPKQEYALEGGRMVHRQLSASDLFRQQVYV